MSALNQSIPFSDSNPLQFPPLEKKCPECAGAYYIEEFCHWCNNTKLMPTEFGNAVLDLVMRNFKRVEV